MDDSLQETTQSTLYRQLAAWLGTTVAQLQTPGVHLLVDDEATADDSSEIWHLERCTVVKGHPANHAWIAPVAADLTPGASLAERLMQTRDDLERGAADAFCTIDATRLWTILWTIARDDDIIIRQVQAATDATAFAAFQARCSDDDKEQGQISLDDEVVYGAWDGARMVAAAGTFELHGFVDVGVLTDPAYRRRGLGAAVVSSLCAHYLVGENLADETDDRLLLYRHEVTNPGSGTLARAIGFERFATIDYVRPS